MTTLTININPTLNGNALDIAEQARRDGVRDLRQSGLVKVRGGVTSLEPDAAQTLSSPRKPRAA